MTDSQSTTPVNPSRRSEQLRRASSERGYGYSNSPDYTHGDYETEKEAEELMAEMQGKPQDPNAMYLQAAAEEATAKAKLTPPVDFSLRIYRVLGEDRSEELGVVPVSVREGQKEVRVAVPPALRAALAQFAKPGAVPTPSPAAPTNGGR